MTIDAALLERAKNACELCEGTEALEAMTVEPRDEAIVVCGACRTAMAGEDAAHWFCLQGAAWSEVPGVQVQSWRILKTLDAGWARDLLDQMYLDEDTAAWAESGQDNEPAVKTVDSNGTQLLDGDSVTLIKDLVVKGANFTAKRGTMVKNIRLGDDPGLVEGRVNKTAIFLKTEFLKKA